MSVHAEFGIGDLLEAFSPAELRDFRGRWRGGGRHELPLRLGGVRTPLVRQVLGSSRDTRDKYTQVVGGRRVYGRERKAQHRAWIEQLFRESGAKPQREGERHIVFVAGGPASGKSSADAYMPRHPNSVEIDQDYFKTKIAEYQRLAAARDAYASDAAHREAADIAHQARLEAMRRGYNLTVQGVGNSGGGQYARKIADATRSGYRTHVFYASAPTEIALERARGRALKSGRAVPEQGLRAMHANVSRRFREVAKLAPALESLQVFDTREDAKKGGKARLMMHLDPGSKKLVIDHARLASEFMQKEREDPGTFISKPHFI